MAAERSGRVVGGPPGFIPFPGREFSGLSCRWPLGSEVKWWEMRLEGAQGLESPALIPQALGSHGRLLSRAVESDEYFRESPPAAAVREGRSTNHKPV